LQNAQPFDPQQIGRYTVVRVPIDFPGQPLELKLFVVLNHVTSTPHPYCTCLKITSQTQLYEATPEALAGCVLYQAGEIPFLPKKSVIQPDNSFNIAHAHFERNAKFKDFRIEGVMPNDFHARLVAAINNSTVLTPKKAASLLNAIGEG
jgi:hypothetical protein